MWRKKKKSHMNYSDLCVCSVVISHWWAAADHQSWIQWPPPSKILILCQTHDGMINMPSGRCGVQPDFLPQRDEAISASISRPTEYLSTRTSNSTYVRCCGHQPLFLVKCTFHLLCASHHVQKQQWEHLDMWPSVILGFGVDQAKSRVLKAPNVLYVDHHLL